MLSVSTVTQRWSRCASLSWVGEEAVFVHLMSDKSIWLSKFLRLRGRFSFFLVNLFIIQLNSLFSKFWLLANLFFASVSFSILNWKQVLTGWPWTPGFKQSSYFSFYLLIFNFFLFLEQNKHRFIQEVWETYTQEMGNSKKGIQGLFLINVPRSENKT